MAPEDILSHLAHAKPTTATPSVTGNLLVLASENGCPRYNRELFFDLLDTLIANPAFDSARADLLFTRGRLAASVPDMGQAMHDLDRSFEVSPRVYTAVQQAMWSLEAGDTEQAARYIEKGRETSQRSRKSTLLYQQSLDSLAEQVHHQQALITSP